MTPEADFATFVSAVEGAVPGGTLPILAAVVCGLVTIYRRDWLQSLLPKAMRWDGWSRWEKWGFSFGTGMVCGTLTYLAAGKPWWLATGLGVGAGIGAMGARETVKAFSAPETKLQALDEPRHIDRQRPVP